MLLNIGALIALLVACSTFAQIATFSDVMNISYARTFSAASASAIPPNSSSVSIVSCSGEECSVTLGGTGSAAGIFGTTVSLQGIQDGRATIRVDDQDVSCAEGQVVAAGPITLRCTRVGDDTVEFAASPS